MPTPNYNRRAFMLKATVATGAAWTAPTLVSAVTAPAAAQSLLPPVGTLYGFDTSRNRLHVVDRVTGNWERPGRRIFDNPWEMTYHLRRRVLYAIDGGYYRGPGSLYQLDPVAGTWVFVGPLGLSGKHNVNGMAYDAETDAIYGCSRTAMFQIDPDTGTAATLGPIAGPATPSLALGYQLRQQTLYGTDQYYLYEVDPDSAVWTRRGIGLGVGQITGLAYDSGSDILYGCSTATDSTYRIDTESGRAILVGQSTHSDANSLAYVP